MKGWKKIVALFGLGLLLCAGCESSKPEEIQSTGRSTEQNTERSTEQNAEETGHEQREEQKDIVFLMPTHELDDIEVSEHCSGSVARLSYDEKEFAALSRTLERIHTDTVKKVRSALEEKAKILKPSDEDFLLIYVYPHPLRSDSATVSYVEIREIYEKGNPRMEFAYRNFDAKDGRELRLSDCVKDLSEFRKLLLEQVSFRFEQSELPEIEEAMDRAIAEDCFTIGYDHLELYLSENGIFNESAIIRLPFRQKESLFSDSCTRTCEDYAYRISTEYPFTLDFDGDGKEDLLRFESNEPHVEMDYGTSKGFNLLLNEKSFSYPKSEVPTEFYLNFAYVAKWEGKRYLLVEYVNPESVHEQECSVFAFKDGKPLLLGDLPWRPAEILFHPGAFMMLGSMNLFEFCQVERAFAFNKDGMPEARSNRSLLKETPLYEVTTKFSATLLRDGKEEPVSLQVGDEIAFFATDGESYVEGLRASDEANLRISFERRDGTVFLGDRIWTEILSEVPDSD